jgi:glutathione S-transferase
MKLYFAPRTRSTRPRWVLEELGVPYELVRLDLSAKENKTPEYLRIHPLGLVPALVDGDVTIFESTAIAMYLAERDPEHRLAPPPSSALRARYYQWLLFCPSALEPSIGQFSQHGSEWPEALREKARARFSDAADLLGAELRDRPFLLGDGFSVADVVVGSNLNWARRVGLLPGEGVLPSYVDRLLARPAAVRAFAE